MLTESQKAKFDAYKSYSAADCQSAAAKRLAELFDDGQFTELDAAVMNGNSPAGVITAYGYVDGSPVYAFSQDRAVKGGAVNSRHAAKICKVFDLASRTGVPVVGIYDSNGAFVDDGAEAIKAYSDILLWTSNLSGVVPQISVIAGTCAGSAAMAACSADFVVITDDGELYTTPGKDIKGEDAVANGTAALSAKDDKAAMEAVKKLIAILPANNISSAPMFEFSETGKAASGTADEIAMAVADSDSVIELSSGFGTSAYTAIATVGGSAVGIAATNKSADKLTSDDCSKLARFVRTCDAFSIPVLTYIDTEGFASNACARDMAKVSNAYAEATTLKVSVVSGKAYGAAMAAFGAGNADVTYAYPEAVISPIAPVAAVEFLWHDKLKGAANLSEERNKLAAQYADENASAFDAASKGCVDGIISADEARGKIIAVLELMNGKRMTKRLPKKHSNMPF
ncbi:MAG: carboxyl transferase [Oscillospiraceae bacterium]|nr:carboxyl transferase [Oscillospiraceae bacterium]